MQIKFFSYKLFAAFFLILAIVVGAMVLSRIIFDRNFKHYVHQMEMERLARLVPVLQEEYRANDSWESLTADPRRWHQLLSIVPDVREPRHPLPADAPPPGMGPPRDRIPPGPPRVLLMDADHRPIVGRPEPNDQRQLIAIEVDGRVVGWLGLHRHEPFKSGPPAILLRKLYLLGGVVIGLTALVAFLFSRHLLKPVQQLAWGIGELANRNFTVRIQATTRDELGQLAEDFNAMAQTLDNFEKMRAQWLTDISHELRTPLTVLRGEMEALLDGVRDATPHNLASLHAEILGMTRLVEDLHLLSMGDSDRLYFNRQWLAPAEILKKTLACYQARLDECRIDLDLVLDDIGDMRLKGDADRLVQVFTNILENVCKYVQAPGILKITGQVDAQDLVICFQDSGPGVPEESLPRLFDRLYRVESSRNRASGGSGLGLSICRQIIKHHHGSIWAEHSSMGGLLIGISLPLSKEHR
jgi:two-component system sensor histidine kinase BaeS